MLSGDDRVSRYNGHPVTKSHCVSKSCQSLVNVCQSLTMLAILTRFPMHTWKYIMFMYLVKVAKVGSKKSSSLQAVSL